MKVIAKSPLRISFAGGGTDVSPYCDIYGGYVINSTIHLYTWAIITKNTSNKITFYAKDVGLEFTSQAVGEISLQGDLVLHKGIYNYMVKHYNNGQPLSIDIVTYSECPLGSGLGGSSSLSVSLINAIGRFLGFEFNEYELASLAYKIERENLGLKGGLQDQCAASFGGFNFMEFGKGCPDGKFLVTPLRIKPSISTMLQASIVMFYTGQSRFSGDIVDQQSKNIADKNSSALQQTHKIKEIALEYRQALLKGDIKQMGQLLHTSWEAKKLTATKITNSQIDEIYTKAQQIGIYGGKISGAGGGGYMMFIVSPEKRFDLIKYLKTINPEGILYTDFSSHGSQAWVF